MTSRHELFMKERMKMEQEKWNAVSPKHYKEILPGYSYMKIMKYLLRTIEGVEAHLIGQMCKYIFRYGKKDDKTQELGKVFWYTAWLMLDQGADPKALRSTLEEAIEDQHDQNV